MKERPIIFSSPMVKALLEGRKTMTRRVVKPHRYRMPKYAIEDCYPGDKWWVGPHPNGGWFAFDNPDGPPEVITKDQKARGRTGFDCPYGVVGDWLWVRETWSCLPHGGLIPVPVYRADGDHQAFDAVKKWSSPLFMPRWASRITLEITDVRVERLQEITGKNIIAEGAVIGPHIDNFGRNPISAFDGKVYLDLMSLWASGWNSINGKGAWDKNPWVWVLSFKRIEEHPHA